MASVLRFVWMRSAVVLTSRPSSVSWVCPGAGADADAACKKPTRIYRNRYNYPNQISESNQITVIGGTNDMSIEKDQHKFLVKEAFVLYDEDRVRGTYYDIGIVREPYSRILGPGIPITFIRKKNVLVKYPILPICLGAES